MNFAELPSIESTWGVRLPDSFSSLLLRVSSATHARLVSGDLFRLPFPPFTAQEIVDARRLAPEWDIPDNLVPVMGDFHVLVCLDYRQRSTPAVVFLDDDRNEVLLSESVDLFVSSLTSLPEDQKAASDSGIIESETWLDI
jgi:hypothetical protein